MKINFYEVGLSRFHGSGLLSFIQSSEETETSANNSMLLLGVSMFARTTATDVLYEHCCNHGNARQFGRGFEPRTF